MTNISYFVVKTLRKAFLPAIRRSIVDSTSKIEAGSTVVSSSIGRHSFCGYDCTIVNARIGSFCSIANSVSIGVGGRHPLGFVSTSPVFLSHRDSVRAKYARFEVRAEVETTVGNDVWIGELVLVRAGVTIGDGAVIGMGSVVTRDVAPYCIVGGVPARPIGARFEPELAQRLHATRWWEWPDARLHRYANFFNDPAALLEELGRE